MTYTEIRRYLQSDKSYGDKISIAKKHIAVDILRLWAVDCAESVLQNYESEYPDDTRVRDCIQATKNYLAGTIGLNELESKRDTAYSAAYAANAANSAAYAAYSAANSAAYSAAYAAYSAAYAAYNAAHAANSAAEKKQKELNVQLLINRLVKKVANTAIARKLYPDAKEVDGMLEIRL